MRPSYANLLGFGVGWTRFLRLFLGFGENVLNSAKRGMRLQRAWYMGQLFKHGVAQWYIANAQRNEGKGKNASIGGKKLSYYLPWQLEVKGGEMTKRLKIKSLTRGSSGSICKQNRKDKSAHWHQEYRTRRLRLHCFTHTKHPVF